MVKTPMVCWQQPENTIPCINTVLLNTLHTYKLNCLFAYIWLQVIQNDNTQNLSVIITYIHWLQVK